MNRRSSVRIYINIQPESRYIAAYLLLTPCRAKLVRSSRRTWRNVIAFYISGLRMHARVGQLHFFAHESKLRYVRDSPEGAVKYSRQSPHRATHPCTAAAKRRNPYPSYTLLLYTTYLVVLCAMCNSNNCKMETIIVRFP